MSINKVFLDPSSLVGLITSDFDPIVSPGLIAPQGSAYLRTTGGAATTLYLKTGSNAVDWSAVQAGGAGSVAWTNITGVPTGLISSSAQVMTNLPTGLVSSSAQLTGQSLTWTSATSWSLGGLFDGGAQTLRLNPGLSADHTFIAFYARSSTPNVRSGWMGYGSAGGSDITVRNDIGSLIFNTTSTTRAIIDYRGIISSNNIFADSNGNPILSASLANNKVFDVVQGEALQLSNNTNFYNNTNHYFNNRAGNTIAYFVTASNSSQLKFNRGAGGALAGYVYADSTNFGLLHSNGNWSTRTNTTDGATHLHDSAGTEHLFVSASGVSLASNILLNGNNQEIWNYIGDSYHRFYAPGITTPGLFLGNSGDAGNYYDNNTHHFRTAAGAVLLMTLDNTNGLVLNGPQVIRDSVSNPMIQQIGNYNLLYDPSNHANIYLGNSTVNVNYYRNTVHEFDDRTGGTIFATINSTGVTATDFILT